MKACLLKGFLGCQIGGIGKCTDRVDPVSGIDFLHKKGNETGGDAFLPIGFVKNDDAEHGMMLVVFIDAITPNIPDIDVVRQDNSTKAFGLVVLGFFEKLDCM